MTALTATVESVRYKGWKFRLIDDFGGRHVLEITAYVPDSNDPSRNIKINHVQPVPNAFWDNETALFVSDAAVRRYVARMIDNVEAHEIGENLWFGDDRPFLPFHGVEGDDDGNPYQRAWSL